MNKQKILKNGLILTLVSGSLLSTVATVASLVQPITQLNDIEVQDIAPTNISTRTDFPTTTYVHKFMNEIIVDGLVNQTALLKYVNIDGLAPRTSITVTQKSINYVSGEITFTVGLDKYYDAQSKLTNDDFLSPVLTLNLMPRPIVTLIEAKQTYPDTRVDRIIASFAETSEGGAIIDQAELSKYVNLIGIPDDATLSIDSAPNITFLDGLITFVITTSTFFAADYEYNPAPKPFEIVLNKLTPKYDPTVIEPDENTPHTIPVNEFLSNAVIDNKVNMDFLEQFIKFAAIPPNTEITLFPKTTNNKTGDISFNLELSQYYNADHDFISTPRVFPLDLVLSPAVFPTKITLQPSYSKTITPAILKDKVGVAPNVNLVELSKYLNIENMPPNARITNIDYGVQTKDGFTVTVALSFYYDASSKLKPDGTFAIIIYNKTQPTTTAIKLQSNPPKDIIVSNFFNVVNPINTTTGLRTIDYTTLAQYVDLSTIPPSAVVSIDADKNTYYMDIKTGEIGFRLITSEHYNAKPELITTPLSQDIVLFLQPQKQDTTIKAKTSYSKQKPWVDFKQYITIDNKIDYNRLGEFLDLSLVPVSASLQLQNVSDQGEGVVSFNVITDKWYEKSNLIDGEYVEYGVELSLAPGRPSLDWLWITIGSVAGVALIVILAVVLQKKRDKKRFIY